MGRPHPERIDDQWCPCTAKRPECRQNRHGRTAGSMMTGAYRTPRRADGQIPVAGNVDIAGRCPSDKWPVIQDIIGLKSSPSSRPARDSARPFQTQWAGNVECIRRGLPAPVGRPSGGLGRAREDRSRPCLPLSLLAAVQKPATHCARSAVPQPPVARNPFPCLAAAFATRR